jgi:uncharacterized protein YcfL
MPMLRLRTLPPLVVLALAAACSSTNVYRTDEARPNAVEFERKISNPFLRDRVNVQSAFVAQADGLLRVQVNVANTSGANALYMYRFTWFDGQGMRVTGNADFWTRRELNAGAANEIIGLAPTSAVVDWRLEIRPWDR